jgi:hypothetical protein
MQDHVSRLVGLDGFRVKHVIEGGDQLDLEVELIARAKQCPTARLRPWRSMSGLWWR